MTLQTFILAKFVNHGEDPNYSKLLSFETLDWQ